MLSNSLINARYGPYRPHVLYMVDLAATFNGFVCMILADLNSEQRLEMSRMVLEMLDSWQVAPANQVILLGLPDNTKPRAMKKYRETVPLPNTGDINARIEHLAGIADALFTSYPRNSRMAGYWLNQPQPRLGGRIPLEMMLEEGMEGLVAVRAHVDCAWDWHQDEKGGD